MKQYRVMEPFRAEYRRISDHMSSPQGRPFKPGQIICDWELLVRRKLSDWGDDQTPTYTFTYEGTEFRFTGLGADDLVARV